MTNIEQQARDEFVKWAESEGKLVALTCEQAYGMKGDHRFISPTTSYAWKAWLAAWNHHTLSAPDNAEVVGLDLSKVQRWDCETESDGIFNHAVMVPAYDGEYVCYADLQAAMATDNDGAAHQHVWLTGVDNTGKWYCARCDETLDPCTNPRPARGKVAVSDEDIFLAEKAAHSIDYSFGLPTAEAAAIYRLVKAAKGEG